MNDHISDMITRIRNAYAVGKKELVMPYTKTCGEIARVMVERKYLGSALVEGEGRKTLKMTLIYVDGVPAMSSSKRVSKPGVRIYKRARDLKPILGGMGLAIISTSSGVKSDAEARKNKLGGEVLLELW